MRLQEVTKCFGSTQVLKDLSLTLIPGEITCMLGPSGCGKSTVLNILAGLLSPDQGTVTGQPQKMGYVFQEDRLLPWRTVTENIHLGNPRATTKQLSQLVDVVGLTGFENHYPHQLSGGMRQRCAIARAYLFQPGMLLMDEPFKSLDYDLRLNMVETLLTLWQEWKSTVVFVTHEMDESLLLGNRILILSPKPCRVKEVITLATPQEDRRLDLPELMEARKRIIQKMTRRDRKTSQVSALGAHVPLPEAPSDWTEQRDFINPNDAYKKKEAHHT